MNEGFSRLLQRADCHKNAPHRNAGRNPAKKPPVKSNQDGDYPKNHPNRRISPIRMAYFDYRPANSVGSSNRSVPSGCGKAS